MIQFHRQLFYYLEPTLENQFDGTSSKRWCFQKDLISTNLVSKYRKLSTCKMLGTLWTMRVTSWLAPNLTKDPNFPVIGICVWEGVSYYQKFLFGRTSFLTTWSYIDYMNLPVPTYMDYMDLHGLLSVINYNLEFFIINDPFPKKVGYVSRPVIIGRCTSKPSPNNQRVESSRVMSVCNVWPGAGIRLLPVISHFSAQISHNIHEPSPRYFLLQQLELG